MLLNVNGLNKSFKGNQVLKNVSFELNEGEILAIIGRSGAGKTTLLRCINGLEKCDKGTIEVDGQYLCKGDKEDENGKSQYPKLKELGEIRKNIGMVFQDYNLFPHMTVLENIIEAPLSVRKLSINEAKDLGLKLLESMALKDKAQAYPCELSGGQKQRVAIARACAMSPKIMCFDEPTSALDPELKEGVENIICDLARNNMAVLIITHDMDFAKKIASKIILMEEGQIIKQGANNEFCDYFSFRDG